MRKLRSSQEYKSKLSENSKRMWQNPKSRAKLLAARRSRPPCSGETRCKIGEAGKKNYPAFYNKSTGEIIPPGRGFKDMCEERGISVSALHAVKGRRRESHRGWILLERKNELT